VSWVTGGVVDEWPKLETDQTAVPLDEVDRNIIAELTRDGRMSVTQVAENVHISRAHAYTRIARLTGEGVLTKFTALVDPIKAGLKSSAYVTLKVQANIPGASCANCCALSRGTPHCAGRAGTLTSSCWCAPWTTSTCDG
jgi:hypothetical protein